MSKTLYIKKDLAKRALLGLDNFPSFHASGSIAGMKKQFYGKDAFLARSGSYIYNVDKKTYNKVIELNKYRRY